LVGGGLWRRLFGGGWLASGGELGRRCSDAQGGEGGGWGGARLGGEQPASIYRRGEAVEWPKFEHEELVRPAAMAVEKISRR
jgi:hypothetical protein